MYRLHLFICVFNSTDLHFLTSLLLLSPFSFTFTFPQPQGSVVLAHWNVKFEKVVCVVVQWTKIPPRVPRLRLVAFLSRPNDHAFQPNGFENCSIDVWTNSICPISFWISFFCGLFVLLGVFCFIFLHSFIFFVLSFF